MIDRRTQSVRAGGRAAAFTLTEVLIAIGIFAIGMTAVAAIFPVALHLQKSTINDLSASQFESNARSLVLTRGFAKAGIYSSSTQNTVLPGPATMSTGVGTPTWTLIDRSYDGGDPNLTTNPLTMRSVFWVPLFYDDTKHNTGWNVYLFIVRGQSGDSYPYWSSSGYTFTAPSPTTGTVANPTTDQMSEGNGLPGVPRVQAIALSSAATAGATQLAVANQWTNGTYIIRPGDQILTPNGTVLTVKSVTAALITLDGAVRGLVSYIWIAVPSLQGHRTFVGIVGPLVEASSGSSANQSSNLVH